MGVRRQWEIANGRESRLVLHLRSANLQELRGGEPVHPQLTKAGLQSFPTATLATQLPALTAQVLTNNRFSSRESDGDAAVMAAVRQGVKHVVFIIKENRTYDQVLGDLEPGNGDSSLVQWGNAITPNLHSLAHPLSLSITSWQLPKSAMTAGRGLLVLAPRTWWNANTPWPTRHAASVGFRRGES